MSLLKLLSDCLGDSSKDKITLSFSGLPPNPNDKSKKHWAENMKITKQWRADAFMLAKAAQARVVGSPALLHYHVSLGDERRHDYDNILASFKPIQDGLVDAGMLADDTIAHVLPIVTFDREKPRQFTLEVYSLD